MAIFRQTENGMDDGALLIGKESLEILARLLGFEGQLDKLMTSGPGVAA